MRFVRGAEQGAFIGRVRGWGPGQALVVPVDVGKATAMAMVVDVFGEVVAPALEFDLHERGVEQLLAMIARAEAAREARMVRVGVEAAGHSHRTLVARLVDAGCEVVELNIFPICGEHLVGTAPLTSTSRAPPTGFEPVPPP
ncbi:MAG: IS110 family transposase [Acidimicrobiales bacterium]